MFLINHFLCGCYNFDLKNKLLRLAGFEIGENVKVVGPLDVSLSCVLSIGDNCWIGKDMTVNGNGKVSIGKNCDVGPNVSFQTGGHIIGSKERRAGDGVTCDVNVEDGCWIGANSTILGNVNIGSSSVIAACACVVKDVPSNALWGGVPAKLIRKIEEI